jgi:hypothetical protein
MQHSKYAFENKVLNIVLYTNRYLTILLILNLTHGCKTFFLLTSIKIHWFVWICQLFNIYKLEVLYR